MTNPDPNVTRISHSPAPWRWSDDFTTGDDRKTWSLVAANGYGILSCDGVANSPQGLGGEGPANANVLQAAPELLAALKAQAAMSLDLNSEACGRLMAEAGWNERDHADEPWDEYANRITLAALAKARGDVS